MGAWIETLISLVLNTAYIVAPYVGAWIETSTQRRSHFRKKSHPMWVRGLKHYNLCDQHIAPEVAPYVGAWIETKKLPLPALIALSHPTRVRGKTH